MQHSNTAGCILLKFYIKPQHTANVYNLLYVVSYRNSTSNHNKEGGQLFGSGVVSYRNSTSNHNGKGWLNRYDAVVSYRNSTSNHNKESNIAPAFMVVSYRNSTSNHNVEPRRVAVCVLYLIEILHQTTTITSRACSPRSCILSKFYIKPQPKGSHKRARYGCILSKFYIKPQLSPPTTWIIEGCILSKFYIKPQLDEHSANDYLVVSYRNSTSNHNSGTTTPNSALLYLIEILHQTTTPPTTWIIEALLYLIEILHQTTTNTYNASRAAMLYLIEILHQTTTRSVVFISIHSCILSKFYIKPQQPRGSSDLRFVVSYRNSTSNHNVVVHFIFWCVVVSYRNSTSNHNSGTTTPNSALLYLIEILHQTTTPPTTWIIEALLYLIEILHQTTTNTYNASRAAMLYLIEILHQTTTRSVVFISIHSCILSKFYIKPQQPRGSSDLRFVVSYRNSTSNHNVVVHFIFWCVVVSYRNSTSNHNHRSRKYVGLSVVSYRNSTSNHNYKSRCR